MNFIHEYSIYFILKWCEQELPAWVDEAVTLCAAHGRVQEEPWKLYSAPWRQRSDCSFKWRTAGLSDEELQASALAYLPCRVYLRLQTPGNPNMVKGGGAESARRNVIGWQTPLLQHAPVCRLQIYFKHKLWFYIRQRNTEMWRTVVALQHELMIYYCRC